MKVSLGSSDMGVSAHLQSSKTGTTRFFTSNTHSSVVLQVIKYSHPVLSCTEIFGCSKQCVHSIDFIISLVIPVKPQKLSHSCAVNAHKQAWLGTCFPVR